MIKLDHVRIAADIAKVIAEIWGIKRDKGADAAASKADLRERDQRIRELEDRLRELEAKQP